MRRYPGKAKRRATMYENIFYQKHGKIGMNIYCDNAIFPGKLEEDAQPGENGERMMNL